MSLEYVLLMALFAFFLMGSIFKGPYGAFTNAGPKLGARVERHLITGDGFHPGGQLQQWSE